MIRTAYEITRRKCKNTETLVPMFTMYNSNNELVTNPVSVSEIPSEYFWVNSDGYGFDIRTLSVLLRVNFRNLNPHTIDVGDHIRPLWCNAADLSTLMSHPNLNMKIKQNILNRGRVLNILTDHTKEILASAACELYSYNLQGLYNWIASTIDFESIMAGLGIQVDRPQLLSEINILHNHKRKNTFLSINIHCDVQAAEHFCEPAGIPADSHLYTILEVYKAGITHDLIGYIQDMQITQQSICAKIQTKLDLYTYGKFMEILRRYEPHYHAHTQRTQKPFMILHMKYQHELLSSSDASHLVYRGQYIDDIPAEFIESYVSEPRHNVHDFLEVNDVFNCGCGEVDVRLSFTKDLRYQLQINTTEYIYISDLKDVYVVINEELSKYRLTRLFYVAISGGLANKYKVDRNLLRGDNDFLKIICNNFLSGTNFLDWLERVLCERHVWTPDNMLRLEDVLRDSTIQMYTTDPMYYSIIKHVTICSPELFEFSILHSIKLNGGYDDFKGSLLEKLQASMSKTTCIQDIAGDLCELLSVPYAPEDTGIFAKFQCDHTNIPPFLVV